MRQWLQDSRRWVQKAIMRQELEHAEVPAPAGPAAPVAVNRGLQVQADSRPAPHRTATPPAMVDRMRQHFKEARKGSKRKLDDAFEAQASARKEASTAAAKGKREALPHLVLDADLQLPAVYFGPVVKGSAPAEVVGQQLEH